MTDALRAALRLALIGALSTPLYACPSYIDNPKIPPPPTEEPDDEEPGDEEPGDEQAVTVTFDPTELAAAFPPDPNGSTFGFPSDAAPFGGEGTSWRFQKAPGDPTNLKFELYLPFTFEEGVEPPPAIFDALREHLGAFTIGELASIQVHTRRELEVSPDLTMVLFTTPSAEAEANTASWYQSRLHSPLEQALELDAPVGQWNAFSTDEGTNQLAFWDYRNSNVNNGIQPEGRQFTLAEMQAGEIQPEGVDEARDYRDQTVKFLTFMTYSGTQEHDVSIDGITITLKDGRTATIDLEGEAEEPTVLNTTFSLGELADAYPPSTNSSFGFVDTEFPFREGGASLRFQKEEGDGASKFELHVPFTPGANEDPFPSIWDGVTGVLGPITVGDIASISVSSRRNIGTSPDLALFVYTTPTHSDADDATWYQSRLHMPLTAAANVNAPAGTWNTWSTDAGTNQIRFWDYRVSGNVGAGPQPGEYFTLQDILAGPVAPEDRDGVELEARDYREEKVKFITLSTLTTASAVDVSIDGFILRLNDGRVLQINFAE